MNKAYLYLYRRLAGSSIRSRPGRTGRRYMWRLDVGSVWRRVGVEAGRCGGGSVWRRAAQTIIKKFYKRNFPILIFFLRLGCRYAPPPRRPVYPPEKSANFVLKFRLIAETSNSRNVHPVSVTFRRFDVSTIRRIGGKAFRRQSVSAGRRFGVSSARCGNIG